LAVDAIMLATYEESIRARDEARRLVARVITDLLRVQQGLGQPAPTHRKLAAAPTHIVRRRGANVVALKSAAGKVGAP
jgi:hypothetical protein